jgi:hypothetical protein
MKLILQRYSDNGESTQGLLFVVDQEQNRLRFLNYTLEDEYREQKVMGETCIPAGLYEVVFREVESPKTKSYRDRFSWFTWHLMLKDVDGFEYVYIHIGNDDDDTDGCILVQDQANNNQVADGFNSASTPAYRRLYALAESVLLNDEKIFIEVRDLLT